MMIKQRSIPIGPIRTRMHTFVCRLMTFATLSTSFMGSTSPAQPVDRLKENRMEILEKYAYELVGIPYNWGGDDPMLGFDCSGLVVELFQSVGIFPHGRDSNAQGLYQRYSEGLRGKRLGSHEDPQFGDLAFYGSNDKAIIHIGLMMDHYRMLEAGSGGRRIKTIEDAIRYNAFTRIRPYQHRSDFLAIVRPYYDEVLRN